MAKIAEYRGMDDNGLKNKLTELEAEYFDLKFQAALSKLENVCLIKHKRRDIARIKTIIKERVQEKVK
ncbi:50S ribosomal protein L29 [Fibrobacterota bacterium]